MIRKIVKFKIYGIMLVTIILGFTFFSFGQLEGDSEPSEPIEEIQYTAGSLRDPFEPWFSQEAKLATEGEVVNGEIQLSEFKVQGIILHPTKPAAIINNQVVKVGDVVGAAKVIEINKDGVGIIHKGNIFIIPAPSSLIREQIKGGRK
ncbi:MAG: hypothetical protein AB1755_01415 [Candidatus Omnitrophota bacterium]